MGKTKQRFCVYLSSDVISYIRDAQNSKVSPFLEELVRKDAGWG